MRVNLDGKDVNVPDGYGVVYKAWLDSHFGVHPAPIVLEALRLAAQELTR